MMTSEENDLLCRVEGQAPMGQLMRRHWTPTLGAVLGFVVGMVGKQVLG